MRARDRQLGGVRACGSGAQQEGGETWCRGPAPPPLLTHECPVYEVSCSPVGFQAYVVTAGSWGLPLVICLQGPLGGTKPDPTLAWVLLPCNRSLSMGIISLSGGLVKLVSFCFSVPVVGGERAGGRHSPYRVGAGDHGCGGAAGVNGYVELWGDWVVGMGFDWRWEQREYPG